MKYLGFMKSVFRDLIRRSEFRDLIRRSGFRDLIRRSEFRDLIRRSDFVSETQFLLLLLNIDIT